MIVFTILCEGSFLLAYALPLQLLKTLPNTTEFLKSKLDLSYGFLFFMYTEIGNIHILFCSTCELRQGYHWTKGASWEVWVDNIFVGWIFATGRIFNAFFTLCYKFVVVLDVDTRKSAFLVSCLIYSLYYLTFEKFYGYWGKYEFFGMYYE